MKAFKYIFFLILIAIIGCAIYIAVQPNTFEFERSRVIDAPTPVIFNLVNDYEEWPRFSPWNEQDTEAKLSYDDKTIGEGAGYSWDGEVLGIVNMKTEQVFENKSIEQQINFVEPFESSSNINWTFKPTENGTKVTWAMEGKQDFMTKMYVAISGSIEKKTGPDFERGLFKLDSIANADMRKYTINVEGVTQHSGGFYLYASASAKLDNYTSKMQEVLPRVAGFAKANNITMAGKPFVIFHKLDEENNAVIFSCCIPTTSQVVSSEADILTGQLQPFKAVKTVLKGDYINLQEARNKTKDYINANNLELSETGTTLESYVNNPISSPNPADWFTEIYFEVK